MTEQEQSLPEENIIKLKTKKAEYELILESHEKKVAELQDNTAEYLGGLVIAYSQRRLTSILSKDIQDNMKELYNSFKQSTEIIYVIRRAIGELDIKITLLEKAEKEEK